MVLIYEEFTKFQMEKLRTNIKIDIFILLIFRDLVEVAWILKENKLYHAIFDPQFIYLKNGYFKVGGFEYIVDYGTKNETLEKSV